ncbi:MAG: hypothetical protein V1889_03170 [archaeon]
MTTCFHLALKSGGRFLRIVIVDGSELVMGVEDLLSWILFVVVVTCFFVVGDFFLLVGFFSGDI